MNCVAELVPSLNTTIPQLQGCLRLSHLLDDLKTPLSLWSLVLASWSFITFHMAEPGLKPGGHQVIRGRNKHLAAGVVPAFSDGISALCDVANV